MIDFLLVVTTLTFPTVLSITNDILLNVTVVEGTLAVLPCRVSGDGEYQVIWMNPKKILLSQKESRFIDDPRMSIERPHIGDWNLHIRNVKYEDRGEYTCSVNTPNIETIRVKLIVQGEVLDLYLDMLETGDEKDNDVEDNKTEVDTFDDFLLLGNDDDEDDDILCTALLQTELQERNIPMPTLQPAVSRIRKVATDEEVANLANRSFADNTKKKIKWALNLFNTWKRERNSIARFDKTISFIQPELEEMTKDEINFSISRFIFEIKKENGEDYPGQTLYELVIQLQLYFESKGNKLKLLSDDNFLQIRNTLDHVMKERASVGLGTEKRKAEIITVEEENRMWEMGVLGMNSPRQLLDTLIYLIGLNFAFRAGLEHRNLRWKNPQITIVVSENGEECLRYQEDVSKTNQGGLASRRIQQKKVFAFRNAMNPGRCLIECYKLYVQHCPEEKPLNSFYLRPLIEPKGQIWYTATPVGINTLRGTVGKLCKDAGIPGFRSNHSLRATAATRLYEAGFQEQMVAEVTGHRSTAVREYKRTGESMKRQASSAILSVPPEIIEFRPLSTVVRVNEGEQVKMLCNASGKPHPKIRWYRVRLSGNKLVDREQVGNEGETLIIHNISRYCGGMYECEADNQVKPKDIRKIEIAVQFPPEIELRNEKLGQYLDKETILVCKITSSPQGVNLWKKGKNEISPEIRPGQYYYGHYRTDVYAEDIYTLSLYLRIPVITPDDFGNYTCEASNKLGSTRSTMVLYEYKDPTPSVTTTTPPLYITQPVIWRDYDKDNDQLDKHIYITQNDRDYNKDNGNAASYEDLPGNTGGRTRNSRNNGSARHLKSKLIFILTLFYFMNILIISIGHL